MKALSLTQPWASLLAGGVKRIETRSWHIHVHEGRPWVAIQASKGFPPDCRRLVNVEPFAHNLGNVPWQALPTGAIIGVARLVGCAPTDDQVARWKRIPAQDFGALLAAGQELNFGDYSPGRWCWYFDDARTLDRPVPCSGALGFWTVPERAAADVIGQLTMGGRRPADLVA